jgi:type VI protein secretion system component VasK
MIIQGPHVISLAVTEIGRWESTTDFLISSPTAERWLAAFQVTVLIILAILTFWQIVRHKHSEYRLKEKITELKTATEELRLEIAEINREQINVLEDILEAEPPSKKVPGFNPQELKALSELAKRLS